MKGLLLKDWYLLKKYFKSYLFVIAAFLVITFFSADDEMGWTFSLYPCLICSMVPVSLLGLDEKSKWNKFSAVMPYTRSQLVSSKYLIGLIAQTAVIMFFAVMHLVVMVGNDEFDFGQYMTILLADFVVSIILPTVWLPLIFKFGIEKGRIFYLILIGVAGAAVASLGFVDIDPNTQINLSAIVYVLAVVTVALYALSWYISIVIYKKKEL